MTATPEGASPWRLPSRAATSLCCPDHAMIKETTLLSSTGAVRSTLHRLAGTRPRATFSPPSRNACGAVKVCRPRVDVRKAASQSASVCSAGPEEAAASTLWCAQRPVKRPMIAMNRSPVSMGYAASTVAFECPCRAPPRGCGLAFKRSEQGAPPAACPRRLSDP